MSQTTSAPPPKSSISPSSFLLNPFSPAVHRPPAVLTSPGHPASPTLAGRKEHGVSFPLP